MKENECPRCDDLGWVWEHGIEESWKVQCHCEAGAKWMLATCGERMAFEAYMKQDKLGHRPVPDGCGSYAVTEIRWAWEAWQARSALGVLPSDGQVK